MYARFRNRLFFWLLINTCVYPEKHQMSGQCKSSAIFQFTHSTDVRSKSKPAYEAKNDMEFYVSKNDFENKKAKIRNQIIPHILFLIFMAIFSDTWTASLSKYQ